MALPLTTIVPLTDPLLIFNDSICTTQIADPEAVPVIEIWLPVMIEVVL